MCKFGLLHAYLEVYYFNSNFLLKQAYFFLPKWTRVDCRGLTNLGRPIEDVVLPWYSSSHETANFYV
jgi:hypothetical protein